MFFLILIVIIIYLINSSSKSSGSSSNNSSSSSSSSTFHSNSDGEIQTKISQQNISQEGYEFYTKVVGVTYDNRQQYIKQCYKGQQLDLIRDKFNPYDKNAIAIYAGDNQLGFLSKDLAQKLAPKMDSGTIYECSAECVTGGTQNFYGLNIKISTMGINKPSISSSNYSNSITKSNSPYNNSQSNSNYNNSQNLSKNYDEYDYYDEYDHHDEYDDSQWTYSEMCEYYGCDEDDWPE